MILARCSCGGGQCNCTLVAGPGITIDGTGSAANPAVISAEPVTCDQVRPCLSAGDGITYDPDTGTISADLSEETGNNLVIGPDGGLLVPAAAGSTVVTDCGLTGDGSAGTPVQAAVGTWPYPCDADAQAGQVYCDGNGVLRSEPRGMANFYSFTEARDYADLPVPAGQDQPGDSFTFDVTNPDPCRPALAVIEREADVDFVLPANGGGAAYGHGTDEMYYVENNGNAAADDVHTHTTKVFALTTPLAPGETRTLTFDVTLGRGKGGATYNRIQAFIRCLLISL